MTRWYILLLLMFFLGCGQTSERKLTVAAAANTQFVVPILVDTFQSITGIECELIIGSSGKLSAQIRSGAPFDVFISADTRYPEELYRRGTGNTAPDIYASGRLVLWHLGKDPPPAIDSPHFPLIGTIAVANPKFAPYGLAAMEALRRAGKYEAVKGNLIFGESISQVNHFVSSGAADLGITAMSVVMSSKLETMGTWTEVDPSLYNPIRQAALLVTNEGPQADAARQFYDFLLSNRAKDILDKFGYLTATE